MKAFIGVDIQECLRRVVEENTLYHKADFEYDIGDLKNAISVLASKNFLWMSRESGTYCFPERDVYLTPSYANNTWLYYRGHPEEIKSFYVEVDDFKDGRVLGSLVALDYLSHCAQVQETMQPVHFAKVTFKDGVRRTFEISEFEKNRDSLRQNYGPYTYEYDSSSDLDSLMYHIRSQRKNNLEPYDFDRYMEEIRLERFARFGYHGSDFVRLSPYDAQKCHAAGLPVFLFPKDEPHRELRDGELRSLRYKSGHLLAIRQQDKPIWDYLNPELPKIASLFTPKELSRLYWCVSNTGKNNDATLEENRNLQELLAKLNIIIGAGEKEAPALELELELEQEQGQEP
ncbi:hypothetical protein [Desulfosporosinus lacus]|uniref:Uncharacterized protein n=1 Tax=Desulfosporosinus lacus DSM 15449 TaxID=1121420 RepID=A0A1M5V0W9_9FIRM|nr:hypothetical protein [Desulfosporosinus lacus]SHH68947.1 hypothetical protein SAMN02746098_01154 [Desulfosporosinus lacus DSM 15449]